MHATFSANFILMWSVERIDQLIEYRLLNKYCLSKYYLVAVEELCD